MNSKEQHIFDNLSDEAEKHDVEIVTVESVGSKKSPIIRIYIDTPNGVSFQELTDAQEWISQIVDEIDPYPGAYTMEVSSPGIDRPLRTPEHFKRFEGDEVKITLKEPIEGRANYKADILNATDEFVEISFEGKQIKVPYKDIKRANLVGKVEF